MNSNPKTGLQEGSAHFVYLPAMIAAIGGLLFGFDTAVINGAIVFIKKQFALSDSQTEIAASSLLLGCVVGASVAAFTSDRFGRKRVLLGAAALFTLSSIGAALPRDVVQFSVARLLGGVAIGIASTLSPLYIGEISPARKRGLLVSLNQLAIVTGILLSYSVNYLLTGAGPSNWRWMFATAALPSIAFLSTLLFIPESPRWLVQKGRNQEAEQLMAQMVGSRAASQEIEAIRAAISEESGELLDPTFRKALIVAILIALFSQFTGINTIIYYGSIVFLEHVPHQTASTALWANVIIGAINFAATIVGMLLIDRSGRKPLLMAAFGGMALSLVAVSTTIHFQAAGIIVLIFVLTYVACFAVGVGTGTWVLMAEICPTRVRGRAMSVATVFLWCGTLSVTLTFLSLVGLFTAPGVFLLYAVVSVAAFLFVWRGVPETKGRTLEEIEKFWLSKSAGHAEQL
ncbi:MAG TPA: sugar porter family MFS transporter [Candidatus Sulfotelmatobacter sp.]|nr:sugar porter family MFS transporter [Candidatus Sulfotelmatobacter sp.]